MATDDKSKAKPMRTKKKSDGWRERQESRAAGITPRSTTKNEEEHEHAPVQA